MTKISMSIKSCLVLVEHAATVLPATWHALSAARSFNCPISFVTSGDDKIMRSLAAQNPTEILRAKGPIEAAAPLIAKHVNKYSVFIASHTMLAKSLMPHVAALANVSPVSDVIKIDGKVYTRPIYAGNVHCFLQSKNKLDILTVRPSSFPISDISIEEKPFDQLIQEIGTAELKYKVESVSKPQDAVDLQSARVVVAGGRGLKSKDSFKMLTELAEKLGGAVGASRAAVDAGYADNSQQIGQTGKVVAPDLYIGVGISGAIQHLAGMKDAKVIIAINNDGDAPIFQIADYGLIQDLFKVVPEINKRL